MQMRGYQIIFLNGNICLQLFVYGQNPWRSFLTITHLQLWDATHNQINPLPFGQKFFLSWFDEWNVYIFYIISHFFTLISCTTCCCDAINPGGPSPVSSRCGRHGRVPGDSTLHIDFHIFHRWPEGGGGGCHLDRAQATWLLYFQTNTRSSSVGQDLISVSLAPGRGDGDKVSGWWLSWAITGVLFFSKATGDGHHVQQAKEVSTHCKSLLLMATGSSPSWHVELNSLASISSHFFQVGLRFWFLSFCGTRQSRRAANK